MLSLSKVPWHPGGAIKRIDDQYWNLDSVRSCVVTICARPHFSGNPVVLAWVRNPVVTILHNFPLAASLTTASMYPAVVALPLRMTLKGEIEKFIIRQPPKGEKDDYDSFS